MSITTVLFDLDDTICEYRTSLDERLATTFERSGIEPFFDGSDIRRWMSSIDADSADELRRSILDGIVRETGEDADTVSTLAAAWDEPDPVDVRFLPGGKSVLETLTREYRLGLVTNGGREMQQTKLDALGIADVFDVTVFAVPGQSVKPSTEPFERALTLLETIPQETVHVGDSLASDVAGANAAGIYSVWIPSPHSLRTGATPDTTIETLSALPEILSSLDAARL